MELFSELFSDANRTMPVLTEITLNKKATAKSHRPAVRKMMDVNSKRNVLGVTSVGKILVKIDTANDLKKMERGFKVVNTANLPKDKKIVASCAVGLRGYLAVRILRQHGFDACNLSGGYSLYRLYKRI